MIEELVIYYMYLLFMISIIIKDQIQIIKNIYKIIYY